MSRVEFGEPTCDKGTPDEAPSIEAYPMFDCLADLCRSVGSGR